MFCFEQQIFFDRDETFGGLQCSKPRIGWTIKSSFDSVICPSSPDTAAEARICMGGIGDLGNLVSPALTGSLLIHVFGMFRLSNFISKKLHLENLTKFYFTRTRMTHFKFLATVLAFITFLLASVFVLRPDLHQSMRDRLLRYGNNSNERFLQRVAVLLLPLLFTLQLAVQLTIAVILDIVIVSVVKRNAAKKTSELIASYGSVVCFDSMYHPIIVC